MISEFQRNDRMRCGRGTKGKSWCVIQGHWGEQETVWSDLEVLTAWERKNRFAHILQVKWDQWRGETLHWRVHPRTDNQMLTSMLLCACALTLAESNIYSRDLLALLCFENNLFSSLVLFLLKHALVSYCWWCFTELTFISLTQQRLCLQEKSYNRWYTFLKSS